MRHASWSWFPVLVLLILVSQAEDWPEFRGPTGQGHSKTRGLPLEWSDTRNVAWKTALPGLGWSSPAYVRGRLYLTTAVSDEAAGALSLRALCVDAARGTILWSTELFAPPDPGHKHRKNSYASPTPLVDRDRLYAHFGHYGTACLDLSGKVLWRNSELAYPPAHGNGGSPVLVGDALIFSCDGSADPFVVALDRRTGGVLWKAPRKTKALKPFSFSTPLVIEVTGRQQVVSAGSGVVCAYEPRTGRELWRADYGEGYSVVPRPVHARGHVFVATGFNQPRILAIRPDGDGDVSDTHVAWSLAKGAPHTPSLLVVGDELYFVSDAGIASCVDVTTGDVHWQERLGGNYSASPLHADGRIYFQNEEGTGVVIQAGTSFEKLAENRLGERTLASVAVGDGALFIRGEHHLFRIQAAADRVE